MNNCELMDKTILDCTKNNRELAKNRFFLKHFVKCKKQIFFKTFVNFIAGEISRPFGQLSIFPTYFPILRYF